MEAHLVIHAENLHKEYRKGTLAPFLKQVSNFFQGKGQNTKESTLALDNVSFGVIKGATLGIIGKNGSGKSTLLKVLSGVTSPSSGRVRLRGKRLSILEIGTGFHPDFTGRENVYLNGAINGLSRPEIDAIFDQIVEFSEIPDFIDTPVKNYSSGMYLRLAFSIIVHLEADILLLDEVIAVGDASFQIKCMEKVRELSQQGRTVVIASHSTNELLSICDEVMYLEGGKIKMLGAPLQVVGEYMRSASSEAIMGLATRIQSIDGPANQYLFTEMDRDHKFCIKMHEISIQAQNKSLTDPIIMGDALVLTVKLEVVGENPDLELVFQLNDRFYNQISAFSPNLLRKNRPEIKISNPGRYTLQCQFPENLLKNAQYTLGVGIKKGNKFLYGWQNIIAFHIDAPDFAEDEQWFSRAPIILGPVYKWSLETATEA
jgi:ABC-type polysaccharide/polyol phosphate transport system ATPase subunit